MEMEENTETFLKEINCSLSTHMETTQQSGSTYYGETSTRPDTIAIGLEYFGKTHLTRCTGKKERRLQDTNKNKIDHIPLCMMINLPKVETNPSRKEKSTVPET